MVSKESTTTMGQHAADHEAAPKKRRRVTKTSTTTAGPPTEIIVEETTADGGSVSDVSTTSSAKPYKRTAKKSKTAKKPAPKKKSGVKRAKKGEPISHTLFSSYIESEYGNGKDPNLYMMPKSVSYKVGMQIPFALQYVLGCGVLPLGVVMEVNGPPMSFKTAFVYEMGRWFIDYGGVLDFIVTEGKIATNYAKSIIGYTDRSHNFIAQRAESMNQWQSAFLRDVKRFQQLVDKGSPQHDIPPGAYYPVLFGIDSVMGANLEEISQSIEKAGHAGRQHPINALSLTNFLKDAANKIQRYPFNLLLINHRKESAPDPSNPYAGVKFTKAGGQHIRFQATYELVLRQVGKGWTQQDPHPNGAMDIEFRRIRIDNGKNSAGTDGRSIEVVISWRQRRVGDKMRQITIWHWDAVIPELLQKWQDGKLAQGAASDKSVEGRKDNMDRFFHFRKHPTRRLYFSETLGMTKDDAVNAEQMGRMIRESPEAMRGIQDAFGIENGITWKPCTDYNYATQQAMKAASEEAQALVGAVERGTELTQLLDDADSTVFSPILADFSGAMDDDE